MKSSKNSLISRGWIDTEIINSFIDFTPLQLEILLRSSIPSERTLAARIVALKKLKKFIPVLCENLKNEKKLYTKIAICESLSSFGEDSIKYLIPMLGTVGKNRHKEVPEKLFGKVNYPLPRDIAARVLIRIGVPALPYLEEVLENGNDYQKPEAVDAIGFISFYEKNESSLYALISLYKKCKDKDELLEWKIIRALESFKSAESIDILKDVSENHENKIIRLEAGRSLSHMKRIKKINYRIR